ncbi:hypothetical protein PSHT_06481 [Puccinia striiformis]|uniref:Uncharacterized protein n=1 Tax=Puccinia striiformis TaxID=27350 RepID=A0A2S4W5T9_9BASI|nr:hypothetical protein PSHT_06481 [Puccinia striiformis]
MDSKGSGGSGVLDVDNLKSNSTQVLILDNICCLVQCTKIAGLNEVTEANCTKFENSCYNTLS